MQDIFKEAAFAGILSDETHQLVNNQNLKESFFFFVFYNQYFNLKKTDNFYINAKKPLIILEDLQAQFAILNEKISEIKQFQTESDLKIE